MKTSIKVEGLNELRQAMRRLPIELQDKALRPAVAAGAKVIATEAAALAPELKTERPDRVRGLLRRMIRATGARQRGSEAAAFVSIKMPSGKVATRMAAKLGKSMKALSPFYWRFLEFGTSRIPAQSFIRKAFDTKKEAAVVAIREALRIGIANAAAKVASVRRW